jgi:hypothetical protein
MGTFTRETLDDGGAYATAAAGYQRSLVFKLMIHMFAPDERRLNCGIGVVRRRRKVDVVRAPAVLGP